MGYRNGGRRSCGWDVLQERIIIFKIRLSSQFMKGILVTVFKYWDINTMQRYEDIFFTKKN